MRSGRVGVFAYGSLTIVEPFSKAIGLPFDAGEFQTAIPAGYPPRVAGERADPRRSPEPKSRAEVPKREIDGIFLDLRPARGCHVSGLVARVSPRQWRSLAPRKAKYRVVDVTASLWLIGKRWPVYTFLAKREGCRRRDIEILKVTNSTKKLGLLLAECTFGLMIGRVREGASNTQTIAPLMKDLSELVVALLIPAQDAQEIPVLTTICSSAKTPAFGHRLDVSARSCPAAAWMLPRRIHPQKKQPTSPLGQSRCVVLTLFSA